MTKKIDRQLKNSLYIPIIVISIFSLNCKNWKNDNSTYCVEIQKKDFVYKDTILYLAKESCDNNVNFCFDGGDQIYRLDGAFILSPNKNNLVESYKNGFFILNKEIYTIDDSSFFNKSDSSVEYCFSKYKKHAKKYAKRNNLNYNFDGCFSYEFYKMKIRYRYIGDKCILVPNFYLSNNKNLRKEILCKTFIIDKYTILKGPSAPRLR